MAADHFVLWNAFPWHSFHARTGMLSNRMPTNAELDAGAPALEAFDLFPRAQFVAVGRVAAAQLPSAGRVWHPRAAVVPFFAGRSRRFCRAFDSV
jgi:hypothetical protein